MDLSQLNPAHAEQSLAKRRPNDALSASKNATKNSLMVPKRTLSGEDVNSRPDVSPSRWVINFFDWNFERSNSYADCMKILTQRVKPERDIIVARGKQIHEYDYWKFWDKRPALYKAIAPLKRVLFHGFTSKYVCFAFASKDIVYAHLSA